MKPGALLLLLLATSCASIVGDDFYIEREHEPPAVELPDDCQPVACSCAGSDLPYTCPSDPPVGCEPTSAVDCPIAYWCCPSS